MTLSMLPVFAAGAPAQDEDISYEELLDMVLVNTADMDVAISKAFPAVIITPTDRTDNLGYGLVVSSALGYNATPEGMLLLEDVPYHASFEHATWTLSTLKKDSSDDDEQTVTVELTSTVNMNKRNPASPGNIVVDDWADVTVRFQVTSYDYSARYLNVETSPDYLVNGTSEIKMDIVLDLNDAIDAQNLAIDMGLMMTENYTFSPTSMPEQYVFQGYQEDGVTQSDPMENETDGDVKLLHEFHPRDEFKQLFTFVEDGTSGSYFGWAKMAEVYYLDLFPELIDVPTFYRTDGDSLRVYLTTPIDSTMTRVFHDPSLGLLMADHGHVNLPDAGLNVGFSAEAALLGVVIGAAVVGAAGAFVVTRRRGSEDPGDIVSLEKNRYYRKRQ